MAVELYPHQVKAVKELHNGAVLRGRVGTGKSLVAIHYFVHEVCGGDVRTNGQGSYRPMERPRDLYIITTAKKRDSSDWQKEMASYGISTDPEASQSGIKVTIDSWNNIMAYTAVKDAFFVFDEQRLVGSGAWVKAFQKIAKANQWILLSATPGDNWMDYIPVFLGNGFFKNRTEFIRRHVVYNQFTKFPKIDRYIETGALERLRRKVLVEMPYPRHTVRHTSNILVGHDSVRFNQVWIDRWNVYEERPVKDIGELFRVARRIVNGDPARLGAVMELMESHPRLIIFYNFDYELDMLRTIGDTLGVTYAEWNGHKHQEVPEEQSWLYLVQYTAGAEGWNCTTTDSIIFWSLPYSYKLFEQAKGRIDRLNTPYKDLFYFVLRSGAKIDQLIYRALMMKKSFNERKYDLAA